MWYKTPRCNTHQWRSKTVTVKDLREKRTHIVYQAKEILSKAEGEARSLSAKETQQFDKLHAEAEEIRGQYERMEQQGRTESELNESQGRKADPNMPSIRVDTTDAVLTRDQSVRSYVQGRSGLIGYEGEDRLSFPDMIRALALGAKTPAEKRALSEGTNSAGGYTVPDILSAELIDRLRAASTVFKAGARTVPLTSDVTYMARLATDPVPAWRSENAAVAESDPTFERVTFTPRSLSVLVKVSRELLEDSVNVHEALMRAFAESLAGEVDRVALIGSGTAPEPQGIFGTTGIGSVSMGANGAALASFNPILDGLYELAVDNAADATAAVMHPRTSTAFAKLVDANSQPLQKPSAIASLPFLSTTRVPITQTQGTATNASSVILGDFTQCMIGVRTSMSVETLKERYSDNMQIGFLAHLRADVQVTHPESFAKIIGIIP